jgi:acyl-[acyl-carrier-protein]-phospholipid O-acyltransferase/long-chain-fatty-acid--[acyl-carrier-protein] ligase
MSAPDISLLFKRRFGPIFTVQFLGAFNDNLLKFALLFLANFGVYQTSPAKAEMLATISTGLFILPYFLFSSLAGQIADAFDKANLVRFIKLAEVGIMALALWGFWIESVPVLLACLFLMGVHSSIFGPVKYSILPQHLRDDEVMGGTGLVEAGTFIAILGGQLLAGIIPAWEAGLVAIGVALLGVFASLAVPPAPALNSGQKIDWNLFKGTRAIISNARSNRDVWLAMLGISWFFAIGAVIISEFAPLVNGVLDARKEVVTLFLLVFSLSIAFGSLIVNKLLKGKVSARPVPAAALALAGFLILLWLATRGFSVESNGADVATFLANHGAWLILIALAGIAISGGIFIVPLYAILQTRSPPESRSQIIAANNVINAGLTVAVVGVTAGLLSVGVDVPGIIGVLGFSTLFVALIACYLLPETVIKGLLRALLVLLYDVKVDGAEHMPRPGQSAVVVVNHVSFLDGLLLAAFLPGRPTFAVATQIANAWWAKPMLKLFDAFPVDPTNPMSAKAMVKTVREGRTLVIFPEGRITVTGALMKVFDGPGMVADKADAPIIPVRIDGAQLSPFSRLRGKIRLQAFPKITLTILPPRRISIKGEMTGRQRRAIAGRQLYDTMSQMIFSTTNIDRTLFAALLDARNLHGGKAKIVEDIKRQPMGFDRLNTGACALARPLAAATKPGEVTGVMLPNVNGVVVTFFALQMIGRVPGMLNYTAGLTNIRAACVAAQIDVIITARAFIDQAKLSETVAALADDGLVIIYLEDVAANIGITDKLRALISSKFSRQIHQRQRIAPDAPAVVLFTSGSEGLPKGVVLSHRNLLSNCAQLAASVDFNASDIVLNALPVFHSFGLTGGTLLPILNGIKTILYPSPLHYRIVPALAYDANATILFGTDTFLAGYARMAHPYDFYSLRYIFAGAERVRDETRTIYSEKFGLRIMEGYGATECSPVLSVNTPMHYRAGTVGRLLPGMVSRLDAVPGITEGGKLSVRGPNVMLGYLKNEAPGKLQRPKGGWHDSGDIVTIDDEGFITIRGRAKRFAKIGGEMVSLPAVEGYAAAIWPDFENAVVTRPDPKKGEQMTLFTTNPKAKLAELSAWGKQNGIAELMIPRDIRPIKSLPVLGTGKLDYVAMSAMASETK